jgi:ATP-dependent Lhr-like helicase
MLQDPIQGHLRCLYVAPLKALVNDVRRTLRRHLREIRDFHGGDNACLRIGMRTGDTSVRNRRRLLVAPPEILLTTPESLALLLSSAATCTILQDVRWVIIDEVHALVSSKRGADLSLALERLEGLAERPMQRIGLSATCEPVEEAARYLVGHERDCKIAVSGEPGVIEVNVEPLPEDIGFLAQIVERIGQELDRNRSTLIFTNTRSLAERLGWALRRRYPEWDEQIAVHHSSIAAAGRRLVERRFKHGRLRAVVSSTSLELGIDIGTVDGVVLVHPPGEVVRLLQRIGRSGHEPGRPRRALVLAAGSGELLEAAVTCASLWPPQLEALRSTDAPLDVLCQHLLGMSMSSDWTADEAYALVRRAYPYRNLTRPDFDACVDYLCGRRGDGTEWLPPRLVRSGDSFTILDERTARIVRRNFGTIVDEEARRVALRVVGEKEPQGLTDPPAGLEREVEIGSLDELYADHLQPGDRFLLDGRCLECRYAGPGDVLVDEVPGRPAVPRWRSDQQLLGPELARRVFLLREQAAESLRSGGVEALCRLLACDYGLQASAIDQLVDFIRCQEAVSEIPEARMLLAEFVHRGDSWDYYIHTPLAHRANDALARVATLRLARDLGRTATSIVADLGFALLMRRSPPLNVEEFRRLLAAESFESDLNRSLMDSTVLRERFRRVATIALMILRQPLGGRRKVGGREWADRRLFDQVRNADPSFVLMRQAEKETRAACDLDSARNFAQLLPRMDIKCRRLPTVSPFAACWPQQVAGPLAQIDSPERVLANLHESLFGSVAI